MFGNDFLNGKHVISFVVYGIRVTSVAQMGHKGEDMNRPCLEIKSTVGGRGKRGMTYIKRLSFKRAESYGGGIEGCMKNHARSCAVDYLDVLRSETHDNFHTFLSCKWDGMARKGGNYIRESYRENLRTMLDRGMIGKGGAIKQAEGWLS